MDNNNIGFNGLPDDVLIRIVKILPITQWPYLEFINHPFQRAVYENWRTLREIKLDENFIYDRIDFLTDSLSTLNAILEKLIKRSTNLKSISGFSEFTKYNTTILINENSFDILAKFKHLERLNFANTRLCLTGLGHFLETSKSRGQLKELDLLLEQGSTTSTQSLVSAFSALPDKPLLKLEKFIFPPDRGINFEFLETVNVTKLTKLKFFATSSNTQGFIFMLSRCIVLENLDINFNTIRDSLGSDASLVQQLLQAITTLPSENFVSLKLRTDCYENLNFQAGLLDMIGKINLHNRLLEFSLFGGWHCSNEVLRAINQFLPDLTSLELEVSGGRCDGPTLCTTLSKLVRLEKLGLYGYLGNTRLIIDASVITAVATNLSNLEILYLDYPKLGRPKMFECLKELTKLKRLRIKGGALSDPIVQGWAEGFGNRLESLELPRCSMIDDATLIEFIKKSPRLRRLNLELAPVTDYGLKAIVSWCPLLNELDLSFCGNITSNGVQAITDGCTMLKRMVFSNDNSYVRKYMKKYKKIKFDTNDRKFSQLPGHTTCL